MKIPTFSDYAVLAETSTIECPHCKKSTCQEEVYFGMVSSFSEFKKDECEGFHTIKKCDCGYFSATHEPLE